jgi:diaminopimelate epimerase
LTATFEEHTRYDRVLLEVMRALAATQDERGAVCDVLGTLCRTLGWRLALFWRERDQRLHCEETWHAADDTLDEFVAVSHARTFARGEGLPGVVWATNATTFVEDFSQNGRFPRAYQASLSGLKGAAAFPVVVSGATIAVIEVYSAQRLLPDAALAGAMTDVGAQLGQFVRRHWAEQELRAREEQYRALVATAGDVRSAAHPDAEASAGAAEWFMDHWNADGSHAEMCGNGARVYSRYLVEAGLAAPEGSWTLATRAGVVPVMIGEEISVGLAIPRVYVQSEATVAGRHFVGTAVDVGNPHLVCPVDEPTLDGLDLTRAPTIDPLIFPAGVNVEFAAAGSPVPGADLYRRMRVSERGVGETLSCGSGACAVAAVALDHAGLDVGAVVVDVPGGRLKVTKTATECWLAGPAVIVAHGEADTHALRPATPV